MSRVLHSKKFSTISCDCLANYCNLYAEKRDMYLAFKALNLSQTGYLTEEEFMDIYSVSKLKWKVRFQLSILS